MSNINILEIKPNLVSKVIQKSQTENNIGDLIKAQVKSADLNEMKQAKQLAEPSQKKMTEVASSAEDSTNTTMSTNGDTSDSTMSTLAGVDDEPVGNDSMNFDQAEQDMATRAVETTVSKTAVTGATPTLSSDTERPPLTLTLTPGRGKLNIVARYTFSGAQYVDSITNYYY